jgi:hypothetical protein
MDVRNRGRQQMQVWQVLQQLDTRAEAGPPAIPAILLQHALSNAFLQAQGGSWVVLLACRSFCGSASRGDAWHDVKRICLLASTMLLYQRWSTHWADGLPVRPLARLQQTRMKGQRCLWIMWRLMPRHPGSSLQRYRWKTCTFSSSSTINYACWCKRRRPPTRHPYCVCTTCASDCHVSDAVRKSVAPRAKIVLTPLHSLKSSVRHNHCVPVACR